MQRAAAFCLAGGLYALAIFGPGPERYSAELLIKDLTRPLVLPQLWDSLLESQLDGSLGERAAKARLLLRYLPGWVDGAMYFAWELASPRAGQRQTPDAALDSLLAAVSWLEESVAELANWNPQAAGEILLTQALLVEIRTVQDPRLGAALREKLGRDASEIAAEYVDRAIRLAPSRNKIDERNLLIPRLIAGALRMGDLQRARQLTSRGMIQLRDISDRELSTKWISSLTRFRAFLDGDPGLRLEDLAKDPFLTEIIAAYRDR